MVSESVEPHIVPISEERVESCRKSASFWVRELPRFADRQQRLADGWAIAAGVLAAATSVSIFPLLSNTSETWEEWLVSGAAFIAAICALIPRIRNYAELAGQARELSSSYGSIVGDLIDLALAKPMPQEAARLVVTKFDVIKEKKDALRGLPDRDAIELRRSEVARRLAEAERRRIEAETAVAAARTATAAAKVSGGG